MPASGEEHTTINSCVSVESSQPSKTIGGNQKGTVIETFKRTNEDRCPVSDSGEYEPPEKKQKEAEPSSKEHLIQRNAEVNDDATFGSVPNEAATINGRREAVVTVDEVIIKVSSETTKLLAKYQVHFSESEGFEMFCPARLDELLKQARSLEESYVEQRKKLKERLARTLQLL